MEELNEIEFVNIQGDGVQVLINFTEFIDGVEVSIGKEGDDGLTGRWFHISNERVDELINWLETIKYRNNV